MYELTMRGAREIARHSKRDAEAYDLLLARFHAPVQIHQPLLMREPPDPTSSAARPHGVCCTWASASMFGEERMYDTLRFWTHERRGFSR